MPIPRSCRMRLPVTKWCGSWQRTSAARNGACQTWSPIRFAGTPSGWPLRGPGALTDAAHPSAGDVLLYQARGDRIRAFIAKRVATAAESVVLLAHSLGGIAAMDLLAMRPLPSVRLLVTVGSPRPDQS